MMLSKKASCKAAGVSPGLIQMSGVQWRNRIPHLKAFFSRLLSLYILHLCLSVRLHESKFGAEIADAHIL